MLQPDSKKYPKMTAQQREQFQLAVAEELAAKDENAEAAKNALPRLKERCNQTVEIVRQLRETREAEGVSLAELEKRTGIRKSALSRLENSQAPNPTLATLQRYAEALGKRLVVSLESDQSD